MSDPKAPRRGRRPSREQDRKDRIIQTRVPRDLESTLKDAAEKKRMTVSHLIRNVLEDTFNLVDGIVADSSALVEHVTRDARRLAATARGEKADGTAGDAPLLGGPADFDDVDAWQEVIVNRPTQCQQCGIALPRGKRAWRGLAGTQQTPLWLCPACLEKL